MTLTEQMKADGWIEHDGSGCPTSDNEAIKIQCANGVIGWVHPLNHRWHWQSESTCGSRIIAYCPEQSQ